MTDTSSTSAAESGWADYPAAHWTANKAPEVIDHLFWHYCAEKIGGPILDLCCGNGRYSLGLAARGYEVMGVDLNAGMIAQARAWAAERGADVRFEVADIVRLDLGRQFRLAIMPGWSIQALLTQEDQLAFFSRLHEHLLPGGAFAFNIFVPFLRQRGLQDQDGVYAWPRFAGYHAGSPRTYDPVTQIETLIESGIHPIKLRHTTLAEFQLLFKVTGFELAELYGDDQDMRPFRMAGDCDYTVLIRRV